jgi:histidinol-phosphate aminotransferase
MSHSISFFNNLTKQAEFDRVEGYVDKTKSLAHELNQCKQKFGYNKVYRFDLGENIEGFSPKISEWIETFINTSVLFKKLNKYPDPIHSKLRDLLADIYNIAKENIIVSAGLDSVIDLIARVFLQSNDTYMISIPDFFLFYNYSQRMGANPVFINLDEKMNFQWNDLTLNRLKKNILHYKPKLMWISNPNNPTGQKIGDSVLHEIIELSSSYNFLLIIDEAYGEYVGDIDKSAVRYINKFDNIMVLRTFSKAYGLAGIRLGYLMTSSAAIINALLLYRPYFPISQFGLDLATLAVEDQCFVEKTRLLTQQRKAMLFHTLDDLKKFHYIPSDSCIFMMKNKLMSNEQFNSLLKQYGIVAAPLKTYGMDNDGYLRFTVRNEYDNRHLLSVCNKIYNNSIDYP